MLYLLAVKVPQLVFGPVCGVPTADSDTVSTDQDLVGYYFVAGSLPPTAIRLLTDIFFNQINDYASFVHPYIFRS